MIVHIIRTKKIPFIQSWPSLPLLLGTIIVMAIGSYLPYSPFAADLGFVPLPASYWLWIAGFMISYALLCHWMKVWFYKRFSTE
jgi:Mg2+-importing ATPase